MMALIDTERDPDHEEILIKNFKKRNFQMVLPNIPLTLVRFACSS